MRRLRDRARRRRTTVTAEIRAAAEQYLIGDETNLGLLQMAGRYASPQGETDDLVRQMADDIERDACDREAEG